MYNKIGFCIKSVNDTFDIYFVHRGIDEIVFFE